MAGKHYGTAAYPNPDDGSLTHPPAFPGDKENKAFAEGASGAANPHTSGTPEYNAHAAGAAAQSNHETGPGQTQPGDGTISDGLFLNEASEWTLVNVSGGVTAISGGELSVTHASGSNNANDPSLACRAETPLNNTSANDVIECRFPFPAGTTFPSNQQFGCSVDGSTKIEGINNGPTADPVYAELPQSWPGTGTFTLFHTSPVSKSITSATVFNHGDLQPAGLDLTLKDNTKWQAVDNNPGSIVTWDEVAGTVRFQPGGGTAELWFETIGDGLMQNGITPATYRVTITTVAGTQDATRPIGVRLVTSEGVLGSLVPLTIGSNQAHDVVFPSYTNHAIPVVLEFGNGSGTATGGGDITITGPITVERVVPA